MQQSRRSSSLQVMCSRAMAQARFLSRKQLHQLAFLLHLGPGPKFEPIVLTSNSGTFMFPNRSRLRPRLLLVLTRPIMSIRLHVQFAVWGRSGGMQKLHVRFFGNVKKLTFSRSTLFLPQ